MSMRMTVWMVGAMGSIFDGSMCQLSASLSIVTWSMPVPMTS